ncbi:hypothetical protein HZA76_05050 [Candidatus Roizmanbacteria bacterium]|nr:hypothetical protein [Candidatus Roizmanbacteria bacterium]
MIAILTTFASFNIVRSRNVVSLETTVSSLINEVKNQQLLSMSGFTQGGVQNPYYGIYFEIDKYILFHTDSYQPGNPINFTINLDQDNQFNPINLTDSQIIFSSSSGIIDNFDVNQNHVTLVNLNSGEQKTIYFNKFGVVYEIN